MKTAIQEFIVSLETFKSMCKTDGEKFIINYAIGNAKLRLEKEKEQIKEAYKKGEEKKAEGANQYYDCTFNHPN